LGDSHHRRRAGALAALGIALSLLLVAPAGAQDSYGPVGNETLWSIATKVGKGRSGTTAQMAWALYRANPGAFEGSPNKVRPGSTLKIPAAALVNEVPAAQAYAYLTGKAVPPAAAAAPRPAPPVATAAPARAPLIAGIELSPLGPGEPYQWFAVVGSGFAPGAVLELGEPGKTVVVRKPQSVRDTRIEYAARFPAATSRWRVVVRNPDGGRSAAYEFDGGATVSATTASAPAIAAAAVATPPATGAFARSTHQAAALGMAQSGQGADAVYRFLAPLEDQYAGDVDFDYQLGANALDSGRFSQAIFVLQRAVSARPGFFGARMELARAYYAQGDNESARREFATLEKKDPPPEARRAIAEYLAAIDRRAVAYQPQLSGYAELGTGYDTNANGAPDIEEFLGFQLDERNQTTASSYYNLGVGGLVSRPLAPGWRIAGVGSAAYRSNPDATFVDSQVLRLAGAVEWRPGAFEYALRPNYTKALLDGEDNHQIIGVDGSATRHFERAQVSLNLRSSQTRFTDELSVLDTDGFAIGLAGQYVVLAQRRWQFMGAVTLAADDAVEAGSPFGRDVTGLRAGVATDLGRGHSLLLVLSTLTADYDGEFFIPEDRSDDQLAGTLGYEWGGLRALGWALRGQVSYVDNSSNVPLYDYDRIDAGISLRKEFR
jgi:outer membrane protein